MASELLGGAVVGAVVSEVLSAVLRALNGIPVDNRQLNVITHLGAALFGFYLLNGIRLIRCLLGLQKDEDTNGMKESVEQTMELVMMVSFLIKAFLALIVSFLKNVAIGVAYLLYLPLLFCYYFVIELLVFLKLITIHLINIFVPMVIIFLKIIVIAIAILGIGYSLLFCYYSIKDILLPPIPEKKLR